MLFSRVINEASLTHIYGYNMAIGRKIILNQYETVIIVNPNAEEEVVERITNDVQELITSSGGVISKVDNWGKRRLAYEVQKNRDGIYVLINFEAEPELIQRLARYYGLDEQVIKYMTVRAEDLPEIVDRTRPTRNRNDDDDDDGFSYRRSNRDRDRDDDE